MEEKKTKVEKEMKRDRASWHSAKFGCETVDVPSRDGRKRAPDKFEGRGRASEASSRRKTPPAEKYHGRCGTK